MAECQAFGTSVCSRRRSIGRKPATTLNDIEEAAALWESLVQSHPFIAGNQRTAFAATCTFLAINGIRLTASAKTTGAFISGLSVAGKFTLENLDPWLRRHCQRVMSGHNEATPTLSRASLR